MSAADLEDGYRLSLARNRAGDRAAGRAMEGPHRSDFAVRHRAKRMEARLCSTGEQKALLLGIVLAHIRLVADVSAMVPVVLLDEIAAHLDADRRAALFDMIDDMRCQTFMTGTDADLFSSIKGEVQYMVIADGEIAS